MREKDGGLGEVGRSMVSKEVMGSKKLIGCGMVEEEFL
jgi:hypothetical protein